MSNETPGLPTDVVITGTNLDSTGVTCVDGDFNINAGATSIFISHILGFIYDDNKKSGTNVEHFGTLSYVPPFLLTDPSTYIAIDPSGAIIAKNVQFTEAEQLSNVVIAEIIHPAGVITSVIPKFNLIVKSPDQIEDLLQFFAPTTRGIAITSNGANLQLNRSAGKILKRDINYIANSSNPHVLETPAQTPMTFNYVLLNSTKFANTTLVDPDNYDNGGILTPLAAGTFTIQRVGVLFDQSNTIQYGTVQYNTLSAALAAFSNITLVYPEEKGISEGAVFQYILIQQGTTNLSDAQFVTTDNSGDVSTDDGTQSLIKMNNLADLSNVNFARINLGVGAANGIASLDAATTVPEPQIPIDIPRFDDIKKNHSILDRVIVNSNIFIEVANFPFIASEYINATNLRITFYSVLAIVDSRSIELEINDYVTTNNIHSAVIATTGFQSIVIPKPASNVVIQLNVKKTSPNGNPSFIRGLNFTWE